MNPSDIQSLNGPLLTFLPSFAAEPSPSIQMPGGQRVGQAVGPAEDWSVARWGISIGRTVPTFHAYQVAKRIFDVIVGTVALIISLPLLAVCVVIIRVCSRGPAWYKQVRVGKGGKLFHMYKLRTMYADAESATGAVWARDNDPRVVPACRWMRRTHVDELPQLINVIKGEMSLVGPRPERPEILKQLQQIYPNINRRLAVLPGITGLAQVRNGYDKNVEDVRRKLMLDLQYIEHCNWLMELKVLAATLTKLYDKTTY